MLLDNRNGSRNAITYHTYTLYLFVKSDIKTILAPITIFAVLAARSFSVPRLLHTIFWVWLHLLQFCVSNQTASPEEDTLNKPWRPIPSGRLSVQAAVRSRWLLAPLCVIASKVYGVSIVGGLLTICIVLHNELGFHSHWFSRNLLNALAYSLFDVGAACVASQDRDPIFISRILFSGVVNSLIILTTIHAQDFRDEEGDRLEGRKTLPIVAPRLGRLSMPLALCLWSFALSKLFNTGLLINASVLVLGLFVGLRFYQVRTVAADQTSYTLYNIWLVATRVIIISSRQSNIHFVCGECALLYSASILF